MSPEPPQSQDRWEEIDRLFQEALDLPRDRRAAFLDRSCQDPGVRAEVKALLAAAQESNSFMEGRTQVEAALGEAVSGGGDAGGAAGGGLEEPSDRIGEDVGPWRLVERLGRGGMATVYRAERTEGGFEQAVALKVIRRGLDTEDVIRRFQGERAILSGLQHPNIARLLDGGATADGLPYLVMELIQGDHVTRYADDHRLTVRERLELFLKIVDTVAHAHRNLVVHRDLKPSNILVTGDGRPVLLDFGIAKLLSEEEGEGLTRTGARWITPGYAAPEQILGQPVTTATDVYQLGVLLFELLTGQRPFPTHGRSRAQVERAICSEDAPRASNVVTAPTEGDGLADTVRTRQADPPSLRRLLAGDLDAILAKALRKEAGERYPSVESLGQDVRRHLDAEPVEATRGGTTYRARKFLRRRPGTVLSAVVFLILILGYAATVTVQSRRIAQERDRATLESDKAAQVTAFLTELLQEADPREAQGEQVTVLDALEEGVSRIGTELADQPEIQAELYLTTGDIYRQIGDLQAADSLIERAAELRRQLQGASPSPSLEFTETLELLGRLRVDQGEFETALALNDSVLAHYRARGETETEAYIGALSDRGETLRVLQRYQEAEAALKGAVDAYRALPDPPVVALSATENNLANLYQATGRLGEALEFYQSSLDAVLDTLGTLHPTSLTSMYNMGTLRRTLGQYADSEDLFRQVVEGDKAVAPESPNTGGSVGNLGLTVYLQGRYDEAEALMRESLEILAPLGPTHPAVTLRLVNLAEILLDRGQVDQAFEVLADAATRTRQRTGEPTPTWMELVRADFLGEVGRGDEAVAIAEEIVAGRRAGYEAPHDAIASALDDLSIAYTAADRHADAAAVLEEVAAMRRELPGSQSGAARALVFRGFALVELGRNDEAAAGLAEADTLMAASLPSGTIYHAEADALRTRLALDRGDLAGAREALAALAAYVDRNVPGDRWIRETYEELRQELDGRS